MFLCIPLFVIKDRKKETSRRRGTCRHLHVFATRVSDALAS